MIFVNYPHREVAGVDELQPLLVLADDHRARGRVALDDALHRRVVEVPPAAELSLFKAGTCKIWDLS